jgi:hypothetical protein
MCEFRVVRPRRVMPMLATLVTAVVFAGAANGANQFDGSYSGMRTTTRGGPPYCPTAQMRISTVVSNGQFSLSYSGVVSVPATVAADGSFSGSAQYKYGPTTSQAKLNGRIASNVLNAELEGGYCTYHYSLNKAG